MAAEEKEFDVFLMIGQSNMAGRATIQKEDGGEIDGASLWNIGAKSWEPAKAPFNRYSPMGKSSKMQRLNPGPSFVRAYRKANPGVRVGIVCAARGGTKIEQWERGGEGRATLYDTAVAAAKAALAGGGTLRGVLWHQGESNSAAPEGYPAKLEGLVGRLREDFGDPELAVVFGQLGRWREGYQAFNAMIVEQPAAIPRTACVTTEGITAKDNAHFDTEGQRRLGGRYAAALIELLEEGARPRVP